MTDLGNLRTYTASVVGYGVSADSSTGTNTARNSAITTSDAEGGSEQLTGPLQTSAHLRPGYSGGPLVDHSSGKVIGMDTGRTAFLGVLVSRTLYLSSGAVSSGAVSSGAVSSGAVVRSVVPGGPAAEAGLSSGDVITSVGTTPITGPSALAQAMLGAKADGSVAIS